MVTANVLSRTFQIKLGEATATCFSLDYEGRQYVITAKHVIEEFINEKEFGAEIFHEEIWKKINFSVIGHADNPIDISVLAAPVQLSPCLPLPIQDNIMFGHDVYFLGFPYGLKTSSGAINNGFPMPFIKKALISGLDVSSGTCVYLDGHNNPGFSGGPVTLRNNQTQRDELIAVISGYRFNPEPVYSKDNLVNYYYKANTGIIISYSVNHAIGIIKDNQQGFKLQV